MTDALRIQDALRAMAQHGRELIAVPPFTLTIDTSSDLTHLNYAVPDAGAADWPDSAVELLRAAFAQRGRVPRLEIVEACWPGLVDALGRNGFTVEARLLGLACDRAALVAVTPPDGVRLEVVGGDSRDDLIRGFIEAGRRAFAEIAGAAPVGPDEIQRFRDRGAGGVAALAGDAVVGRAGWQTPQLAVSEIVGVGVVAEHRRRGIAGALTAAATLQAFAAGADLAFLTPGDEGAARVYARAGFTPNVHCVHVSRPHE